MAIPDLIVSMIENVGYGRKNMKLNQCSWNIIVTNEICRVKVCGRVRGKIILKGSESLNNNM